MEFVLGCFRRRQCQCRRRTNSNTQARLNKLLSTRPYLKPDGHYLYDEIQEINEALLHTEKVAEARQKLANVELKLNEENRVVKAAFGHFDHNKDGHLEKNEVTYLLDYLGFPCSEDWVSKFVRRVDNDSDNVISIEEFVNAVGHLGGSVKLFQNRTQQIENRQKFEDSKLDKKQLHKELAKCGIDDHAQLLWRVVTSGSELDAAAALEECQKKAISYVRKIAKANHERAFPKLQARVEKMGYTTNHLRMTLAWIRELSPIIIHVNLDTIGDYLLKDTHYRNQFETGRSEGLRDEKVRRKWERSLFGPAYDNVSGKHRPKYGVQNVWNDPRGVMGCKQYGDSYIVLKGVRLRSTLSPEDSGNDLDTQRLAVLDYYAHVLATYSDIELKEILDISDGGKEKIGDSEAFARIWGMYKEAQVHGYIDLKKHVDRVVVSMRHKVALNGDPLSCGVKSHSATPFTLNGATKTRCTHCCAVLGAGDVLEVCWKCEFVLCPQCTAKKQASPVKVREEPEETHEFPEWLDKLRQEHGWTLTWMEDMQVEMATKQDGCEMSEGSFAAFMNELGSSFTADYRSTRSESGEDTFCGVVRTNTASSSISSPAIVVTPPQLPTNTASSSTSSPAITVASSQPLLSHTLSKCGDEPSVKNVPVFNESASEETRCMQSAANELEGVRRRSNKDGSTWTKLSGKMTGRELRRETSTIQQAKATCTRLSGCSGFYYRGSASMAEDARFEMVFCGPGGVRLGKIFTYTTVVLRTRTDV